MRSIEVGGGFPALKHSKNVASQGLCLLRKHAPSVSAAPRQLPRERGSTGFQHVASVLGEAAIVCFTQQDAITQANSLALPLAINASSVVSSASASLSIAASVRFCLPRSSALM